MGVTNAKITQNFNKFLSLHKQQFATEDVDIKENTKINQPSAISPASPAVSICKSFLTVMFPR